MWLVMQPRSVSKRRLGSSLAGQSLIGLAGVVTSLDCCGSRGPQLQRETTSGIDVCYQAGHHNSGSIYFFRIEYQICRLTFSDSLLNWATSTTSAQQPHHTLEEFEKQLTKPKTCLYSKPLFKVSFYRWPHSICAGYKAEYLIASIFRAV